MWILGISPPGISLTNFWWCGFFEPIVCENLDQILCHNPAGIRHIPSRHIYPSPIFSGFNVDVLNRLSVNIFTKSPVMIRLGLSGHIPSRQIPLFPSPFRRTFAPHYFIPPLYPLIYGLPKREQMGWMAKDELSQKEWSLLIATLPPFVLSRRKRRKCPFPPLFPSPFPLSPLPSSRRFHHIFGFDAAKKKKVWYYLLVG